MKSIIKTVAVCCVTIFLASCTSIPCKKQLIVTTYESSAKISIDNYQKLLVLTLKENEQAQFDISEFSSGEIKITTSSLNYAYEFGEYDHWFPVLHKIILNIHGDHIDYNSGNLRMYEIDYSKE